MTSAPQLLPHIPVVAVGPAFPMETLLADEPRAHLLMDAAIGAIPDMALRRLDAVSRRWLTKHDSEHLPEIDAMSQRLGRAGGYFLAVNYEWGCTVGVGPAPDGRTARMARTLDWYTAGLGRYIIAARVAGAAGPFVTMTWPGFTGVLQGMAPGRFCASLNQAPMRRLGGGLQPLDWLVNRMRVWNMPYQTPGHLLRRVFEKAPDYRNARSMLASEPISTPVTFTLSGLAPEECCVIERSERDSHVMDGEGCATNHWRGLDHGARPRGEDSPGRLAAMREYGKPELDSSFPWLRPPILNRETRLAMVADAALGRLVAQGFEDCAPATAPLALSYADAGKSAADDGDAIVAPAPPQP